MGRDFQKRAPESGRGKPSVCSPAVRLIAVLAFMVAVVLLSGPASAQESPSGAQKELSADEIARELANPNTPLANLTFKNQYRLYTGDLPHAKHQDSVTILFQPSFPLPVSRTKTSEGVITDMIFFRPAFPLLIEQPVFDANKGDFRHETGMGDIGFDLMWGRSYPSGMVVGGGVASSIPTGKKRLSSRTWTLGPEAVLAFIRKWGVVALRPTHEWNIGGTKNQPTSNTTIQPVLVFLPGGGWSIGTAPELNYDWKDSQWTVPLNLSFSRTVKLGKTPLKIGASVDYYVERPDAFAPKWMFSLNITPVVPNVFAKWLGLVN